MLAIDFHIIDRKISIGYQQSKSFGVQHAMLFP